MYRAVTLSVASTTTSYFETMANALFVVSCTGCLTYVQDEFGRKILKTDDGIWSGSNYGITYKKPFVFLSNGDKIRVEGEEGFRSIKKLPTEATSKDGRAGEQLTDDVFGSVSVQDALRAT